MAKANINISCIEINLFFIRYAKCGDISLLTLFWFDVYRRIGKTFLIFGKVFNKTNV